jgi:hypothetical protein
LLAFFSKHKNRIFAVVAIIVVGIIAYSSWYSRKNKHMEEITTALVNALRSPASKNEIISAGLLSDAPVELKPILMLMKSGRKLSVNEEVEKNLNDLLSLSQKQGVDIIWKDLALIIYVSYRPKSSSELIALLEPLMADGRPFRFTAMELVGMIHLNNGAHDKSLEILKKIKKSKEAPDSLKRRISVLLNYIENIAEKSL